MLQNGALIAAPHADEPPLEPDDEEDRDDVDAGNEAAARVLQNGALITAPHADEPPLEPDDEEDRDEPPLEPDDEEPVEPPDAR